MEVGSREVLIGGRTDILSVIRDVSGRGGRRTRGAAILAATARGDLDRILALADELVPDSPGAARVIRDLAERLEYERIMSLLAREASERPGVRP